MNLGRVDLAAGPLQALKGYGRFVKSFGIKPNYSD